jgi:molybdenum cofactor biosynthesis enzyme
LTAEASVTARAGVETEAMTACAVRGVTIEWIALLEKSGSRSGDWRRGE